MKIKPLFAAFLITIFAFTSCQKDSTTPTPTATKYPVEGLWIGTYTIDNSPSESGIYFYSYAVYKGGSILIKGMGADGNTYYSSGQWALSSTNVFSSTYTTINFSGAQVTQTMTANFSNTGKMTEGVWTDTKNGSQTGKLTMERVN
jgi:hypothetical protein